MITSFVVSLVLLTELSVASEAIKEVGAGQSVQIEGPAVYMPEHTFRRYVMDSRELMVCREGIDRALNGMRERDIQIQERDAQIDQNQLDRVIQRNRADRNIAIGLAGGFLAGAATTAIAVSLSGN